MGTSDSHHVRRLVAGGCMVLAPLLFLGASIVSPKLDADGGEQLALLAGDVDRWLITQVAGLVGLVLFVPAVLGLMHMLRERQSMAGHIGGGLVLIGTLAAVAATGMSLVLWQMAKPGLDPAQMTLLADRVTDSGALIAIVFVPTLLIAVGMIVLAGGLARAHAVSPISALFLAAGAVALVLGAGVLASVTLAIAGSAVFAIGLVPVGWIVLRETDEEWEHTPEVHGVRPAAGLR